MATKYKNGGATVTIGRSQDVSLPARVFRGRATCMRFDTDKAFLLPTSIRGIRNIVTFFEKHAGTTMLVNGHTDLVGDAQYNLQLSNERAAAVAAYLVDNVDAWLAWYRAPIPSKRWSTLEDQHMLQTITDDSGKTYYSGAVSGYANPDTQAALKRFQTDNGLGAGGVADEATRRALIGKYMALTGTSLPATTTLLKHGCGKFHPIDNTKQADQGNRRVEIFLFDGVVDPPPQDHCPAPGCREYSQWIGNPEEDIDLCQPQGRRLRVVLLDLDRKPRNGVGYRLTVGAVDVKGVTIADGLIDESIPDDANSGTLTYDGFARPLTIAPMDASSTAAGAQPRLANLGLGAGDATKGELDESTRLALMRFQERHALDTSGELDDATAAKLKEQYGA